MNTLIANFPTLKTTVLFKRRLATAKIGYNSISRSQRTTHCDYVTTQKSFCHQVLKTNTNQRKSLLSLMGARGENLQAGV